MDFKIGDTVIRTEFNNGPGAKVGQRATVVGHIKLGLGSKPEYLIIDYLGCMKSEDARGELWLAKYAAHL